MMTALGLSNHSWMIFVIIVVFSPAHILIPATRTLMANQVTFATAATCLISGAGLLRWTLHIKGT